jgi:hypothetical protein
VRSKAAKNLETEEFKRLCGVSFATFEQMVKVVAAEKVLAKKRMRVSAVLSHFHGRECLVSEEKNK